MNFRFGAARKLYEKNIHPRVIVDQHDIQTIRRQTRSGDGARVLAAMRARSAAQIERALTDPELAKSISQWNHQWNLPGTGMIWALPGIAMIALVDEDDRALQAAVRILSVFPEADAMQGRDKKTLMYGLAPKEILTFDLMHSHLSPQVRRAWADMMVSLNIDHMLKQQYPSFYRRAGANIPLGEVLAGLTVALVVQGDEGVPDLTKQRDEMMRMFEASLYCTIGPEGYPAEDMGYGSGMGGWLAWTAEIVRRAGLYDVYESCPRFKKFGQALLQFMQPWGRNLSNTGDHGDDFGGREFVLGRLARECNDPTMSWLLGTLDYPSAHSGSRKPNPATATEIVLRKGFQVPVDWATLLVLNDLPKPRHPRDAGTPLTFHEPSRGLVTFRSSWRDDATFLLFDGSQRPSSAQGHAHDSGGHFSLSALGEYFAIDTGRYNNEQDQHNVVLINGKPGHSHEGQWRMTNYQGKLTAYQPGRFVDYASADSSQQSDCYWSFRHIGLVKSSEAQAARVPSYAWTVDDVNYRHDWAEFWWAMNTDPDNRIALDHKAGRATVTGRRMGNLLDVHFALLGANEYKKPHRLKLHKHLQLCGSDKYLGDRIKLGRKYAKQAGSMVHGPVYARPRLVGKVSGYNGRFMTVMLPRRKGTAACRVRRVECPPNAMALRLELGPVVDTLIWAYDHCLLQADGVDARGQWCVVRRDARSGKVLDHAVGNGESIKVDGKTLPISQ